MLAGCADVTTNTPAANAPSIQNLQQVAAVQCPIITGALATLTSLQGLPASTQTGLAVANATAITVCKSVSTINATSMQSLITSVTPVIIDSAKSAGMAAAQQNDIVLAVGLAQTAIQIAIQEQQANALPAVVK